jgi:hypothetical protein
MRQVGKICRVEGCHQAPGHPYWLLPFRFAAAYLSVMTKLLDKALKAVRRLPPDSQDQIALAMLSLSGNGGEPEAIDPAHLPDVLEGLAQAKRREFASDAEVEAAFRRFER